MQFIDTHIHLQDFDKSCATDLSSFGVDKFIVPAIKEEDWAKIEKLYLDNPDKIIPAFGLHPWHVREVATGWQERLREYLRKYPNALVGECGLDRHRDEEFEPQNSVFMEHIAIAKEFSRPLLIHAVRCQDWLEKYWKIMPKRFVFHSYNARRELLKKVINAGGYVSLSSSMIRNREKDKIVPAIPLDRLMLETDGPYQGEMSVLEIAKDLASILNILVEELADITYKNTQEFIKID